KLYMFESKVVDRITKSNMSFIKLERTSDIRHIQRRRYFRFDCTLPIEYRKFDYLNFKDQKEEAPFHKSFTKNISGGGVCAFLNENIGIHQRVECRIKLEDNIAINFLGHIIRIRKLEQDEYQYETGIAFDVIENRDRETIIKYIFKQQRQLRSKGLI
ncbi:MAG TPA: PilZ domain-containing protein, partial [Clostridiaceae bacterium]|nr:PilZ domain-containing protein [Clostridiaceae bacterium]